MREVRAWQSGAMGWLLKSDRPAGMDPIPPHVKWDEWIGVAPMRPYLESIYHPLTGGMAGFQQWTTG